MKTSSTLTAAILLSTTSLLAQDAYDLGEIVVSAGIQDISINKTGTSVTIIEGDDLAAGVNDANTLLDTQSGIAISASGGLGSQTGIRMRGLSQNYVGVYIDGVDMSDPSGTQNAFDFGGLNTLGYDRIEILKGSQSAIYGSEAIGGVINLKTNANKELGAKTDAILEIGSHSTTTMGLRHSQNWTDGSVAFALNSVNSAGFSAKDSDEEADGYSKSEVRLVAERDFGNILTAGFTFLASHENIDYDGFTDETGNADRKRRATSVYVSGQTGNFDHKLSIAKTITDRYDENGWNKEFIGIRDSLKYTGATQIAGISLSYGIQNTIETAQIDADEENGSDNKHTEMATFVEANYGITQNADISLAVRNTNSDEFGANTTYRLAGVYRLNNDTTLRAVASSGYRAPSLYELFAEYGGNAELEAEESQNFEIGIEKGLGNSGKISATAFVQNVDNLILYDNNTWAYVQSDDTTKTQGVEIAGHYNIFDSVTLSGSYTHTTSKTGEVRAVRVPTHDLVVGINADISHTLSVGANVKAARDLEDYVWPENVKMKDYTVVDLNASYAIGEKTTAYIRIQNALDKEYQVIHGYNTGGRQIFAGIHASF